MRLDPSKHAFLSAPDTLAVMDALSPGETDRARIVGGAVRNALQGVRVEDVDIATQLTPQETMEALKAAGIKAIPTGLDHGTITAVVKGKPFEITTLRKDVSTDGRRAVVAFTTDWAIDASRRDFRLNAIYARRDGSLFDPYDGIADALAHRVVFIGDADQRLAEDVLRILRFYRFNAWYGSDLDAEGHAACVRAAPKLEGLARERVWKELKKLLAAPDPGPVVKAMQEGHVFDPVWPGRLDLNLLLSIINADRGKARAPDTLVRAAALCGGDVTKVRNLASQMKASNAEADRLAAMCAPVSGDLDPVRPGADAETRRRALYVLGAQAFSDRMRLAEARGEGHADADLEAAAHWRKPVLPVTGRDLIEQGFEPGPQLGAVMKRLEAQWIESDFNLDRSALLALAAEAKG
jgi:poly(A) polymerase